MATLSEDILLVIFERLDIDTLLNTRLSCRRYYDLISSHIIGLASAVAHVTFPDQQQIFSECSRSGTSVVDCLRWLQEMRLHQLGAITVERKDRVMADDPLGRPLRAYSDTGWAILAQLVRIHDDVRKLARHEVPRIDGIDRTKADDCWLQDAGESDLDIVYELETCKRRCHYLESLSFEQLRAYKALWDRLLMDVLGYSRSISAEDTFSEPGHLMQSTVWWILGQVHRQGLGLFWTYWWLEHNNVKCDRLAIKHILEGSWSARQLTDATALSDSMKVLWNEVAVRRYRDLKDKIVQVHGQRSELAKSLLRGPRSSPARKTRKQLTLTGEPPPMAITRLLPYEQKLSCEIMGEAQWQEKKEKKMQRRHISCHYSTDRRSDFAWPCDRNARLETEEFKVLISILRRERREALGIEPSPLDWWRDLGRFDSELESFGYTKLQVSKFDEPEFFPIKPDLTPPQSGDMMASFSPAPESEEASNARRYVA